MVVDTNIIVRFITGDPKGQSLKAKQFFAMAGEEDIELRLLPFVIAECVYVLHSVYELEREKISMALTHFINTPEVIADEPEVMIKALELYGKRKLDFVDCYLAAQSLVDEEEVVSFDKDFGKIEGVRWLNPNTYKSSK